MRRKRTDWSNLKPRGMRCPKCGRRVPEEELARHLGTVERQTDSGWEIQCIFCHRWVRRGTIDRHLAPHLERGPDGQQRDHVTLAPERRFRGSLAGVPQVYIHEKCGEETGMPEEIIRSYLVNPFLYNDLTFCTGCRGYVHASELRWTETGDTLYDYTRSLRDSYVRKHGAPPCSSA
jgi:hypothetical protein